ncbi:unnamed protein product [Urochloa decumbens]|uniref:Uncharacterized protein n=1 Tax=Urochloa decumbens TaxID=240449 RepID=A0ABC8Y410_9POAL
MAAAASSRRLAAACVLAVLLVGCLAAAADARRLLLDTAPAMPPAMADDMGIDVMSPAQAPAPESGADDDLAGRMLFHGRGLLDGGARLAGRLLIGLGL